MTIRMHTRGLACLAALLAAFTSASIAAQPARPTAEDLFRHPAMERPVLSPDGRRVAVILGTNSGRDELAVIDLEHREKTQVVAGFTDADVESVYWVNDQRLVFTAQDLTHTHWIAPGLFAVNHDGSDLRRLIEVDEGRMQTGSHIVQRNLSYEWDFYSTLADGGDDVIVSRTYPNQTGTQYDVALARLDTKTRSLRTITAGAPSGVTGWLLDHRGVPRAAFSLVKGRSTAYWRDKDDGPWTVLAEWDAFTGEGFEPFHLARDGTLYVLASSGSKDTAELHRYDFAKKAIDPEPIIALAGFDLNGRFQTDRRTGKVLGLHYLSDAAGTVWFDPEMRKIQERVDAALPGTINRLSCGNCETTRHLLVQSWSDRQPLAYFLYDRESKQVEPVGKSRPWLDARQMGRSDFVRFTARDGMSIPTLVTYPPGPKTGPRPAVVLVHGGPWVRGSTWGWNPQAQYLATAGYVVIEPSFRGTTGFGRRHFQSSWKQWGLAMQDDVADAALWAVKEKIADGQRMCIAGASYGGYATLMGLAKNPELFKCGIDWVGVTDIDLMYSITWSDSNDIWQRYGMPTLVGDRVKDKAQLDATSPIRNARKITQPLLMAYGRRDRRVPIEHGREFLSAVKPFNANVEYIEYSDEGHGWRMLETNVDFWARVEAFLARNIGAKTAP